MKQYAAISDLEGAVKRLAQLGGSVALVFDPKRGWLIADQARISEPQSPGKPFVAECSPEGPWQPSISQAIAALCTVRFVEPGVASKMFQKQR